MSFFLGGVRLMSLGMALETELGDEFGRDFDELDEFWGAFPCVFARKGGGGVDEFGGCVW